ncbi:hypothetical protein [Brevundimonas sp.]
MGLRVFIVLMASASVSGCFVGDDSADEWSTPEQIKAAASRCGLDDFEPTRAGGAWAAYVDETVPDHQAKEDCIYSDLAEQGRLTTR